MGSAWPDTRYRAHPTRPKGVAASTFLRNSSSFKTWFAKSVSMYQGATALTRTPCLPHSTAKLRVS